MLCGGSSTRMGADKAWIGAPDDPLAVRVAGAVASAGCDLVLLVGGDGARAAQAGLCWIPDDEPGAGPLGAIASVARRHPTTPLLVAACDLPSVEGADLLPLLVAVRDGGADVAVFDVGGRPQWSGVALSADAARLAERSFRSGERSLWRPFSTAGLDVQHLEPCRVEAVIDADRPEDLPERLRSTSDLERRDPCG